MNIHDLKQGSQEWHEVRERHLCASDAPAMMGESRYKSRNQLLEEKATGKTAPVPPEKQALFDRGHAVEAQARELMEMKTLEDFKPMVVTAEVEGLSMLASLDGYSFDSRLIFEHKLYNDALAKNLRSGALTADYYWQLEHQLLVAHEAEKVLFVVSDGTFNNWEAVEYISDPERRKKLIAGWHRFIDDKAAWKPTAKAEVIAGAEAQQFPMVEYHVVGSMVQSNIHDILPIIKDRADEEMARPLETDQDFADKENSNKAVKSARKKLRDTVDQVQGEFASFSDFAEAANKIDSILQKLQSHGERAVKQAKDQKRKDIAAGAASRLSDYIAKQNAKIEPLQINRILGGITPDWSGAMKNKRTIESLQNAVDEELNRIKIDIDQAMAVIHENFDWFKALPDYRFLFTDLENIINQPHESFKAVAQQRINAHEKAAAEKAERDKAEAERRAAEKAAHKQAEAERRERAHADLRQRVNEKGEEREKAEADRREQAEAKEPATVEPDTTEQPLEGEKTPEKNLSFYDAFYEWSDRHNLSLDAIDELVYLISEFQISLF
mgnify:CR=1 FL=1